MSNKLLPTTLVGSYPQPEWLINRGMLASNTPPRVRMRELWRVDPELLEGAQDDATLIAVYDQERAGIDIAFAASCLDRPPDILLYFSLEDRLLRRAVVRQVRAV